MAVFTGMTKVDWVLFILFAIALGMFLAFFVYAAFSDYPGKDDSRKPKAEE